MGGRPRKPTKVKILQGTFRKDQEVENEPKPSVVTKEKTPPKYLNKWAREMWRELVHELIDTGILTKVDWNEFIRCCDFHGMFMEAREAIYTKIDEDGNKTPRTMREYLSTRNSQTALELSAMRSFNDMYKSAAINLGLNPIARGKINVKLGVSDEPSEIEKQWQEMNG